MHMSFGTLFPGRSLAVFGTIALLIVPGVAVAHSTPAAAPEANLDAASVEFYVDPDSNAQAQAAEWRDTRPEVADHPQADWFGDWTADPRTHIGDRVTQVVEAGALPVMVVYNIPYRDCGLYSAGGANDPEVYRAWIEAAAEGIGDRPAVVVLEPDALASTDCLSPEQTTERYDLLGFAVDTLEAQPEVDVYIDAGNATWHPPEEAARRLGLAGIDRATGFALNVSNYLTTEESAGYGLAISDAIGTDGGTRFVIDTSRNGNGAWESDDPEAWCNPPGRALGEPPTVETANPLVDAWLWIKRPGESDGECRGAPAAGVWYPEYALKLARNAAWD